jgi:hypothetical protein
VLISNKYLGTGLALERHLVRLFCFYYLVPFSEEPGGEIRLELPLRYLMAFPLGREKSQLSFPEVASRVGQLEVCLRKHDK